MENCVTKVLKTNSITLVVGLNRHSTVERQNLNVWILALLQVIWLQNNQTSEIGTIMFGFQTFGS